MRQKKRTKAKIHPRFARKIKKIVWKQTGIRKSLRLDRMRKALPPGWRISATGKLYFENRKNRSDRKGKKI